MNEIRFGDVNPVRYTPLGRPAAAPTEGPDFGATLTEALSKVNEMQLGAGDSLKRLVAGEDVDLHEVMISSAEAGVAFDLMMEIRNKLVDAYQEIQRMQV